MKRNFYRDYMFTAVLEVDGDIAAESTPLSKYDVKQWIAQKKKFYAKYLERRSWRIYLKTMSEPVPEQTKLKVGEGNWLSDRRLIGSNGRVRHLNVANDGHSSQNNSR